MSFVELASQFHFLRPLWLLALILVPIVLWLSSKSQSFNHSDWNKTIPPELLQHLLVGDQSSDSTHNHWKWLAIIIAIMALGLAGPTWQQKPQPLHQQSNNLVIVLDLSLSMLASDQKPDRLTRAKHKLRDLLEQRKEGNTSLIAYSGDSYVVTPLTDDINTLKSMLPPLDPFIMPTMGSRPELAIEQAIEVLKNGNANDGKILLITDGIEEQNIDQINSLLEGSSFPLSVLAVGTEAGGPINIPERGYLKDKGSVIIPKTDFGLLSQLASNHSGIMEPISFSDSDIEALKAVTDTSKSSRNNDESDANNAENNNGLFDQWHDEGYWFALLLIPIVLLGHRKGAFSLVLLCSLIFQPNEAMAFEWKDLWKTPDQQAMELVKQDPAKAAELFNNQQWKGSAHYKAKDYESAQKFFDSSTTPTSLYNKATALAQQQKFEDAIAVYKDVLEQDETFTDAATNKALIEKFLEEQQSQDQESSDKSDQSSESDQSDSDSNDQQQDQGQQSSDQSDKSDSQSNNSQQNQNQQSSDQSDQSNSESGDQQQNQGQQQDQNQQDQSKSTEQSQSEKEKSDQEKEEQKAQEQASKEPSSNEQQAAQAQAAEQEQLTDEETQAFEQWMRRVPDDPGGLLRRKFAQQHQQKRGQQRQEQGQPIW